MKLRWMHPPELQHARTPDRFDPVRAAEGHRLPRELALAIWDRACADATDGHGRRDAELAERRFHELAARIAARGGRLRPDVGRLTRVETETTGAANGWAGDELAPRAPGREPLVAVEARRWAAEDPAAPGHADATAGADLPGAGEVTRAMTALMRRTFGASAGDVPIATDSARPLAAGAEGVAVGEQVYIAPGYYDLETTAGRERLGHEVAHVLQQRRGRGLPGQLSTGDRAGLEAEADRAGHAFARGQPFAVQGRAPAQIALFKGAAHTAPAAPATTLDLKAGGRIERKPPAGGDAAPAARGPRAREQLIVSYGSVQASNPFTLERDDRGEAVRLIGRGTISLPASQYMKKLDLVISLGPDGYVGAKLQGNAATTIKIGGLAVHGGKLTAAIDHGQLSYALDGASLSLPKNLGDGALTIQGNGDQEPAFDASLTVNVPKLQPSTMSFHADAQGYRAEGSTGVDIDQVSGSVQFSIEKVGDDKALWSAAGSVGYSSERLSGQLGVQYNADGELSGEGTLDFRIADFLTGKATVALDKQGHVAINGEIRPPGETRLFPEKKVEQTFFHKSVEFPIWGISIPAVGSVGIIAFIEGSMGYRVGVGAGVMRDIVLSGSYSTDPNVQPTFQISGEIFIPAYAELLISIGGGVKLDAFIAEIGGGLKIDGRAGFYGGLSVRPTLAYEDGKYRLMGQALLAGDVGLSADIDAFVRLHVGKWFLSWEKEWDWKLGEWHKWLGLNLGMEADLDYTLGQPLSPEIFKLKKPDSLDVQGIAQSAMPKDGMPPDGPRSAQNQHNEFKQKGGGAAAPAAVPAAQPQVAGTPAGAAGHKNQDPKGKTVKPAAPPKPGPARPARGKNASQTGPAPKNHSKPSEQKLDATPIVEPFTMHGEPHQLIVQLGPAGHVDMASRRERLSVKVGHAVGKLIAKHASPEQIAELKAIGELARKGDKMVATAKLPDKDGARNAAHQIAAYGNKWQVHDLDEVAIKKPSKLVVTQPAHLTHPALELARALVLAPASEVIHDQPGDPKQVARRVLEDHSDARFEFSTATLTLPALHPDPLTGAHSLADLARQLAQQTGVSRITIKKTEQKDGTRVQFIGAIGASAALGDALIKIEDWLGFKLPREKIGRPTKARQLSNQGGQFTPHAIGDKYQTAYIATIATASAASEDGDPHITPPQRIGEVYAHAFDLQKEPHALQNRFALVVGVNKREDLDGKSAGEVQSNVSAGVGKPYPWGIVGFTWQQPWQTASGGPADIEAVRAHLDTLPPDLQARAREFARAPDSKARVPMGAIRDTIHQSSHTRRFADELAHRAHHVFIQVGDGDAVALNPPGEKMPYFNRFDRLVEAMVSDITRHGHETSASGKHRPIIASGGYQLILRINPGDGGSADARTVMAAELDMKVRAAMAKVDPGLVYFPEPSFLIEVTEDTFKLRFGNPASESRGLIRSAITRAAARGESADLAWDERTAMVTTSPERFEVTEGATMMREWVKADSVTAEDLKAMLDTSQNHASLYNWVDQIRISVGLPQGKPQWEVLEAIYRAAFPVHSDRLATFEPVKGLHARLEAWHPDHAEIAERCGQLQKLLEAHAREDSKRDLPTANQTGGPKAVAQRVGDAAEAAGRAIRDWLLPKLPPR